MEEGLLRELAEEYLLPLFSGAQLDNRQASHSGHQHVAFSDPCTLLFKVSRRDPYRLVLRRSQPFAHLGSGLVTEKQVVEAFVEVVKGIEPGLKTSYKADLLATFQRRVVATAIAAPSARAVVLDVLDQLAGSVRDSVFKIVPRSDAEFAGLHFNNPVSQCMMFRANWRSSVPG
jgi:hypothetical protein